MSSAVTFVTCRNWQGWEICDLGGSGFCFVCFVFRFRPGADKAMFSGLLVRRSTFCQNSVAALLESKLNPIILLWSVCKGEEIKKNRVMSETSSRKAQTKEERKKSHRLKGTSCGTRLRRLYSWTNCRSYLSTVRSRFHVPPAQRSHAVNFDSSLILYRTSTRERPCKSAANPFS